MLEEHEISQALRGDEDAVGGPFLRLVGIMRRLLAPDGCPWDREQTHESLRPYLIEEAYEVLDAIDAGGSDALCEELGDLLLQIVFHAELARRAGRFQIGDVARSIGDKLVRRHPHVFSEAKADTARDVETQWDRLKKKEGAGTLSGVSRSLPALRRAQQYGERTARVGFDWPDPTGPRSKVDEELEELDRAIAASDRKQVEAEIGDLLLAVSSLARHHGVEGEDALRSALDRFEGRYADLEARLASAGRRPEECSLEELDNLWNEIKGSRRRGGEG